MEAENGVVHVINAVLLPPSLPATVVDIIVNSPDHNTLEAAVIAAGLADDLSGAGPFTVFAPTDAAFAALPAGTVEALLADIPALTNILTYHVVGAEAFSSDLTNGQMIMTLQGSDVEVTINGNGVFINDAQVTVADLEAENGVVHVINAVLLPGSVGIETVNNNFVVYPNPAETQAVINFTTEQNVQQVNILDANGRLVNQQFAGNQNVAQLVLNVSELPAGLYFVEVISAAGRNIQKLSVR